MGRSSASFRGVKFDVTSHAWRGGRHVAKTHFTQRDETVNEDTGRQQRLLPIQGFVVGTDHAALAKRLIDALEAYGPGQLIHPRYGHRTVNVDSFTARETGASRTDFSIDFSEDGEALSPTLSLGAAGLTPSVDALKAASAAMVSNTLDLSGPAAVLDGAVAALTDAVQTARDSLLAPIGRVVEAALVVTDALNDIDTAAASLLTTPADMVAAVQVMFDAISNTGNLAVLDALRLYTTGRSGTAPPATAPTATDTKIARNGDVLARMWTHAALGAAATAMTDYPWVVYDDAALRRDDLVAQLTAEAEVVDDADVGAALADVRVGISDDIDTRASGLARLMVHHVDQVTSSLELAHELYGDASRAGEIAERNFHGNASLGTDPIDHPGFIGPGAYLVLSS